MSSLPTEQTETQMIVDVDDEVVIVEEENKSPPTEAPITAQQTTNKPPQTTTTTTTETQPQMQTQTQIQTETNTQITPKPTENNTNNEQKISENNTEPQPITQPITTQDTTNTEPNTNTNTNITNTETNNIKQDTTNENIPKTETNTDTIKLENNEIQSNILTNNNENNNNINNNNNNNDIEMKNNNNNNINKSFINNREIKNEKEIAQTPSLRLLKIHAARYVDCSDRSIKKYIADCPYNVVVDSLIEQCMINEEIFNYFDKFALHDPAKTRIFVRGLSYETNAETLKEAFKVFGNVTDSTVIYDKNTSQSKGYGFITYETCLEAKQACRTAHLDVEGRRCQIALATPLRHATFIPPTTGAKKNARRLREEQRISRSPSRSRSRGRDREMIEEYSARMESREAIRRNRGPRGRGRGGGMRRNNYMGRNPRRNNNNNYMRSGPTGYM